MAEHPLNNRGTYFGYFNRTDWNFVTRSHIDNPPSLYHSSTPLTLTEERSMRQRYAIIVLFTGCQIGINMITIHKAIIYLQRFYALQCFQDYNAKLLTSVSLFTACKYDKFETSIPTLYHKVVENEDLVASICIPDIQPKADVEQAEEYMFVLHKTLKVGFYIPDPIDIFINICIFLGIPSFIRFSQALITTALISTPIAIVYSPEVITIITIISIIRLEMVTPHELEDPLWFKKIDGSLTEEFLLPLADEFYEACSQVSPCLLNARQLSDPINMLEITG